MRRDRDSLRGENPVFKTVLAVISSVLIPASGGARGHAQDHMRSLPSGRGKARKDVTPQVSAPWQNHPLRLQTVASPCGWGVGAYPLGHFSPRASPGRQPASPPAAPQLGQTRTPTPGGSEGVGARRGAQGVARAEALWALSRSRAAIRGPHHLGTWSNVPRPPQETKALGPSSRVSRAGAHRGEQAGEQRAAQALAKEADAASRRNL